MVLFSSIIFIFFFLPLTLGVYFLTPQRFKNLSLLVMSLLFYYWTEKNYVLVLITSICANYGFALLIEKYGSRESGGKGKIALSIASSLQHCLSYILQVPGLHGRAVCFSRYAHGLCLRRP